MLNSPDSDPTHAVRVALGEQLRTARVTLGLTQEQVALEAGTDRPTVVQIEAGQVNPRLGTLIRVAGAVGLDVTLTSRATAVASGSS